MLPALLPCLLALLSAVDGPPSARAERELRLTPVARIAPVAPPNALPLLDASPRREIGTPERYVDRAALRSALYHRRHADLTRHVETFQAAFEKDPSLEPWPDDAAKAFGTGEPDLLPLLDAWVKSAPSSFAPWLARGAHWVEAAWARRGGAFASKTPREDFDAMEAALASARADLEQALRLRPRLVAAQRLLIEVGMAGGRPEELERAFEAAVEACPTCLAPCVAKMRSLEPRWGGSLEEMEAFAEAQARRGGAGAPRLAFLRGYADEERVTQREIEGDLEGSYQAADRLITHGEHGSFYWRRGRVNLKRSFAAAGRDLERARQLDPGEPGILISMARLHQLRKEYEQAARWLRSGLALAPLDHKARRWLPSIRKGLLDAATRRAEGGRVSEALRLVDLGLELTPEDTELQALRTSLLRRPDGSGAAAPEDLEGRLAESPDDVLVARRLAAMLTDRGETDRVIALWSRMIRHRDTLGRAYLGRAAALLAKGEDAAALADFRAACGRGESEGCAAAARLDPPPFR